MARAHIPMRTVQVTTTHTLTVRIERTRTATSIRTAERITLRIMKKDPVNHSTRRAILGMPFTSRCDRRHERSSSSRTF